MTSSFAPTFLIGMIETDSQSFSDSSSEMVSFSISSYGSKTLAASISFASTASFFVATPTSETFTDPGSLASSVCYEVSKVKTISYVRCQRLL